MRCTPSCSPWPGSHGLPALAHRDLHTALGAPLKTPALVWALVGPPGDAPLWPVGSFSVGFSYSARKYIWGQGRDLPAHVRLPVLLPRDELPVPMIEGNPLPS